MSFDGEGVNKLQYIHPICNNKNQNELIRSMCKDMNGYQKCNLE